MRDFKVNRKKNLDLVLCKPRTKDDSTSGEFSALVDEWQIRLSPKEKKILSSLPQLRRGDVGAVQVALEAKACMTAHVRALPRLYDELNSSQLTIHGASDVAIAVGFVMVNMATRFLSSDMNKFDIGKSEPHWSHHKQPRDTVRAIDKVTEIRRRGRPGEEGFDAMGLVVVDCKNDGSTVKLVTASPPAPAAGEILHYESMIHRIAQLYDSRFAS
jgi:hypothetical protein